MSSIKNNDLYDFYYKYKKIINGEKSLRDALNLIEKMDFTAEQKELLKSVANGMSYTNTLDMDELNEVFKNIDKMTYREEVYEYINQIIPKTDIAQYKCILRKANMKQLKPHMIIPEHHQRESKINKKCPHCGHSYYGTSKTQHVVCGYNNNGYDWKGCNKDWCFTCEKKLCKSWSRDQLYLQQNRFHNKTCCEVNAKLNGYIYPDDYCQCKNDYVDRTVGYEHD